MQQKVSIWTVTAVACALLVGCSGDSGSDKSRTLVPTTDPQAQAPYYSKLSSEGELIEVEAARWNCVVDKRSGLVWEVKSSDKGLQNRNNSYSWFNPQVADSTEQGMQNGGICLGSRCDTASYVEAMNQQKVCGRSNWRLPSRDELLSLVEKEKSYPGPVINDYFFANTVSDGYWTAASYSDYQEYAWGVLFKNGREGYGYKSSPLRIRLVSEAGQLLAQTGGDSSRDAAATPAQQ